MKLAIYIDTDNPKDVEEAKRLIAEIEKGKKPTKPKGKA